MTDCVIFDDLISLGAASVSLLSEVAPVAIVAFFLSSS